MTGSLPSWLRLLGPSFSLSNLPGIPDQSLNPTLAGVDNTRVPTDELLGMARIEGRKPMDVGKLPKQPTPGDIAQGKSDNPKLNGLALRGLNKITRNRN